jgi:hypothetical protein
MIIWDNVSEFPKEERPHESGDTRRVGLKEKAASRQYCCWQFSVIVMSVPCAFHIVCWHLPSFYATSHLCKYWNIGPDNSHKYYFYECFSRCFYFPYLIISLLMRKHLDLWNFSCLLLQGTMLQEASASRCHFISSNSFMFYFFDIPATNATSVVQYLNACLSVVRKYYATLYSPELFYMYIYIYFCYFKFSHCFHIVWI